MKGSRSSSGFRATVPHLPVADATTTLEFYVCKLGFEPLYRFDGEAGVARGDIIVRFCKGEPITNEHLSVYFEITDTDTVFEQFRAAGVDVVFAPKNQPWGSRDFCIKDPDGYRLVFGDFRDDVKRTKSSGQMAPAIEAMMAGEAATLSSLLNADPDLINEHVPAPYRNGREATLLHLLMDYPHGRHPSNVVEIAKLLIDAGADVNAPDGDGSFPLHLLVALEPPVPHAAELTCLLLDAGARFIDASDDQHGMDAFASALLLGHTECAALMYERGYPPDFPWAGAGLGNMDLVRAFFGEGGSTALPAEQRADSLGADAEGQTNCAFLVAAINGQTEVVAFLLDKGMDVDMQPPGSDFAGIGGTALHWAARKGRQETAELLVARGASLTARDDVFQLTPAGWAAWFKHDEIGRFLMAKEAD